LVEAAKIPAKKVTIFSDIIHKLKINSKKTMNIMQKKEEIIKEFLSKPSSASRA